MNRPLKLILVALSLSGSLARAQNFEINWHTIDGGGGTSSGGSFSLSGTIGQPDAGVMGAGTFTVTGGFWAGITLAQSTPLLRIFLVSPAVPPSINARVTLAWPSPSTGYQLEASAAPAGAPWAIVPNTPGVVDGENRVTLEATGTGRMFRLRSP